MFRALSPPWSSAPAALPVPVKREGGDVTGLGVVVRPDEDTIPGFAIVNANIRRALTAEPANL